MYYRNIFFLLLGMALIFWGCKHRNNEQHAGEETTSESCHEHDTVFSGKGPIRKLFERKRKPLRLVVENLAEGNGPVRIGVFCRHNKFPSENDKLKSYKFIPQNGKIDVEIEDLEYGEFALAVYHDANNNGEIDKNGLGIPTERYGFSNNVKPLLKAPDFKIAASVIMQKAPP